VYVACLGWGSLVWDPRELPVVGEWFKDGPPVRIEFARRSRDRRITLVVDDRAEQVRVLWAPLLVDSPEAAREALARREGVAADHVTTSVGLWVRDLPAPAAIPGLDRWAAPIGLDAVVWTSLRPRRDEKDTSPPTMADVLEYLAGLRGQDMLNARRYVVMAPPQIDTAFRREIEATLGWVRSSPV